MIWDELFGHERQVLMFRRSVERGRLSHAYVLTGIDGIGKKRFALTLAQCLLCSQTDDHVLDACGECPGCRQVRSGNHPDLFLVAAPEGKRDLPIEAFVGPKPQRGKAGLCFELSRKPMLGTRKIAVIDDANLMNESSGNALLKTLEEPPPGSLLLLISNNEDGLLSTIRSRCQHVHFHALEPSHIARLLMSQGLVDDQESADKLSGLCQGSLATAKQLMGSELHALRNELHTALAQGMQLDSVQVAARTVEGLEKLESDGVDQRLGAAWVVDFVSEFYHVMLREMVGARSDIVIPQAAQLTQESSTESAISMQCVMELIETALESQHQLANAVPVGLCLEGLFDDLKRILRDHRSLC